MEVAELALPHSYPEDTSISMGTVGAVQANAGMKFKKIPIKLDIETLDLFLAYAYDIDNKFITRSALNNMFQLVNLINLNLYKNHQGLRARIDLLQRLLEARLHMGFDNRKIMLNYALDNSEFKRIIKEEILQEFNKIKLNSRMTQYLNSFVVDRLIFGFMFSYKDEIFRIFEDLESNNFTTLKDITQEFKGLITNLLFDIRNAENFAEDVMTLDLSEGNFENVVKQIVKKLKDPSNKLISGMQALNIMLNGGFEQGRSYLFFGLTGVGKSVLLINLMIAIKLFNKVVPKDPSKRPCVLYISQENTVTETVERIFNMQVTGANIRDYTASEVVKLLRTKGKLTLTTDDDIDIVVKYFDDKAISTMDLYSIISDIEDTGREVIALIHDYIERIRSSREHQELRFELAEVANDYSVVAKRLGIPVIGAGQFSRKASDLVETSTDKYDISRLLGKSHISEAFAILKNIDSAVAINKETDANGQEYMCFNDMKQRSTRGKKNPFSRFFAHPIDPDNGIKLLEDIQMDEPLSRLSLNDVVNNGDIIPKGGQLKKREVKELKVPRRGSNTSTEVVEDSTFTDFKALESIINNRKKANNSRVKVVDEPQVDSYGRNERGFIKIIQIKELSKVNQEWADF